MLVLAGLVATLATPGVGDARQRALAITREHQVPGPHAPVASRFAAAIVATEDSRFYDTPGVDPISLARAGWGLVTGQGDTGAATLDQQLAKQLYFGDRSAGIASKAAQATVAVKLDATYSKTQILAMYAAVVYFGHGYWGLQAASHGYFNLPPQQLSWGQAALLAGLVQAPTADDPLRHPDRARARQQHVLGRLVATGRLTHAQARTASGLDLASRR